MNFIIAERATAKNEIIPEPINAHIIGDRSIVYHKGLKILIPISKFSKKKSNIRDAQKDVHW